MRRDTARIEGQNLHWNEHELAMAEPYNTYGRDIVHVDIWSDNFSNDLGVPEQGHIVLKSPGRVEGSKASLPTGNDGARTSHRQAISFPWGY